MIGRLRRLVPWSRPPTLASLLAAQGGGWRDGPTFVLSFDVETAADCLALPRVRDVLADHAVRASFASIGTLVERYPREHAALADAGHELFNHTDTHPWHDELGNARRYADLTATELAREVSATQDKLSAIGVRSIGFRAPHFGAQSHPLERATLRAQGIAYSSSTLAALPGGGAPQATDGVTAFPLLPCPRHPGIPLDSWHCSTAPGAAHPDATDLIGVYTDVLALIEEHDAFGSVYWDPRALGLPGYDRVVGLIAGLAGRVVRYADLLPTHAPA